jgi:PAS domain S-box-containing protein
MASVDSRRRNVPASVISRAFQKSFTSADGLLDRLPVGIAVCDLQGSLVQYNQRAAVLWGHEPEIGSRGPRFCGAWKTFWPNGAPVRDDESPMALLLESGEPIRDREYIVARPDGTQLTVLANLDPLLDDAGKIVGGVNCFQDITARRNAEEEKAVLLRELAHRVNNTFAVIFAITQQTLRAARSPEEFAESFTGRLQALAGAHHLLLARDWCGASLAELATTQLAISCDALTGRVRIDGPLVILSPAEVVGIGALLHELGVNACKYGALSTNAGAVDLTWTIRPDGTADCIDIVWTETGGPAVVPPAHRGLGAKLIERGLANAKVDWRFEKGGLVCTIALTQERRLGKDDAAANDNGPDAQQPAAE